MTIYFISGLGVDKRIFNRLKLSPDIEVIHLDWIEPTPNEPLSMYALRLGSSIDISKPFGLVGLSFGGMIATEIAKVLRPIHVILLSSASTTAELPVLYRFAHRFSMHKLLPGPLLKFVNPFTYWLFGARTMEEKKLLKNIIHDTNTNFLKWAIGSTLNWDNETRPSCIYHIHGTNDKVIPCKNVRAEKIIKNAGHLMVLSHADEVSLIINEKLSSK